LCSLLSSTAALGRPESYFREPDEAAWAERLGVPKMGRRVRHYRDFVTVSELPVEVLVDGGHIALQGRQADVSVSGLEPGYGRLGGPHTSGHGGLGQALVKAMGNQIHGKVAPALGDGFEAGERRLMGALVILRSAVVHLLLHLSYDIS